MTPRTALPSRRRDLLEEYRVAEVPSRHPSLFEPATLVSAVVLALLGVVIGLELLTRVGITPNSSIIGAVVAIALSRIPLALCRSFGSLPRQNLLQTVISGATFGGANAILMPMGVLWLLGRPDLVPVMMLGAFLALGIDATILYYVFDSKTYPAQGPWPAGVATAECIIAGDKGGRRAGLLGIGAIVGGVGQSFGVPMDVFGVCWIGNMWALSMFGLGLLIGGYAPDVIGVDIGARYVPHGIMIGAGVIAFLQIVGSISARRPTNGRADGTAPEGRLGQGVARGFGAFVIAATIMALAAGLHGEMPAGMLVGFIVFAAVAALISELIVGISAMHAGWFPGFATALIFLVVGMLLGFPLLPLAFLVGFTAATGPAFADMGYDLKAGWILRGKGEHAEFEQQGRRQQYLAELLGFVVAAVVVLLSYERYFANDLLPPVDRVYAATIEAGARPGLATSLLLWAIPGAIVQLIGGRARQIGILFATGLLINNTVAGWTALASLGVRALLLKRYGEFVQGPMYVLAGGFIAGSAVTNFGTATATGIAGDNRAASGGT